MTGDRNGADDRQTQLDAKVEEFREEQHRRLVKLGIALWKQTETAQQAGTLAVRLPKQIH